MILLMLMKDSRRPTTPITVHAGHCHSATRTRISSNLEIQVAGTETSMLALQEILMID
jgi:hypothetical protein